MNIKRGLRGRKRSNGRTIEDAEICVTGRQKGGGGWEESGGGAG